MTERSERMQLAVDAPIDFEMVQAVWGREPTLYDDSERAGFFGTWVAMRFEWADEMLRQEREHNSSPPNPRKR